MSVNIKSDGEKNILKGYTLGEKFCIEMEVEVPLGDGEYRKESERVLLNKSSAEELITVLSDYVITQSVEGKQRQRVKNVLNAIEESNKRKEAYAKWFEGPRVNIGFSDFCLKNSMVSSDCDVVCELLSMKGDNMVSYVAKNKVTGMECASIEPFSYVAYCVLTGYWYVDKPEMFKSIWCTLL